MNQLLSLIALVTIAGAVFAADDDGAMPDFTHAKFVEGDRSLKNLIEFPDIDFDAEITLMCNGIASAKGRLQNSKCSSPGDPDLLFTMSVSRVFNTLRVVPATVNGREEEVDFQFVVIFKKAGAAESIDIHLNNQKNVDRLGLDYISAQRYSPHPLPNRCAGWQQDDLFIEAAIVDTNGRPRDVNVMSASAGIPPSCRKGLINQLEDARWIPAMYQGQYVESVWINPIVLTKQPYKRQQ